MFLNGSLENFSVADILQLLSFSRQSGALYVQGEVGGVLYLEDGDVYFARRDSDWPLKDTLFANGVDESDWEGAVDQSGASNNSASNRSRPSRLRRASAAVGHAL